MRKKPFFADTETVASRPGEIRVDYFVWVRCFPLLTIPKLASLTLAVVVSLVALLAAPADAWGLIAFSTIAIAGLSYNLWAQAITVSERFVYGCLNPAVVVSVNPYLIAVYADLTSGGGSAWPAIKILPQPLQKARGLRLQIGGRLATVSIYSGSTYSQPFWSDFYPIAVNCVTDDEMAVRDALWRLNQSEHETWDELEESLALVPKPYRPGLYWMRPTL